MNTIATKRFLSALSLAAILGSPLAVSAETGNANTRFTERAEQAKARMEERNAAMEERKANWEEKKEVRKDERQDA